MLGRLEEAGAQITYDKLFEVHERVRAKETLGDEKTLKRDIRIAKARVRALGRGLLNPNGLAVQLWDFPVLFGLLYTLVMTPYEIGFLPEWEYSLRVNLIITGVFVLDMIKEFFLYAAAYPFCQHVDAGLGAVGHWHRQAAR